LSTTKSQPASAPVTAAVAPVTAPKAIAARRRRPALIGLSLALMAVGGLAGTMVLTSSAAKTRILVVSQPLTQGQVITAQDLTTASITLDPSLSTVAASDESRIVGKHAAAQLAAGSTLTMSDVTAQPLVAPGDQLVGILAKPGQLPGSPLAPGSQVLVVTTPQPDSGAPTAPPQSLPAQVVRVGAPDSSGNVLVDVSIDANDGPTLAARVFTGDFAIVLQSPSAVG